MFAHRWWRALPEERQREQRDEDTRGKGSEGFDLIRVVGVPVYNQ